MQKTYVWYTRDGIPRRQKTQTFRGIEVSVSNATIPGDVIVTGPEYDALRIQYDLDIFNKMEAARLLLEQNIAADEVIRQSAITKLVAGIPLTQTEAEVITLSF